MAAPPEILATDTSKGIISLVDNTEPHEQDLPHSESLSARFRLTKYLTKGSVRNELQRRKYNKWQPERLGVSDSESMSQGMSRSATRNTTDQDMENDKDKPAVNVFEIAPVQTQATESVKAEENPTSNSDLEILYENQRGWFFFGIPLYSDRSLLQIDPPAWVNKDYHDSPVNITNAQLPDPSWEWAWPSWYVDMSDDVDEEGWQYSFSFTPKCGWHGTHPWFHSYVRRRRWVRLRVKKRHAIPQNGAEQSNFHLAHMLNEDYFTIHSQRLKTVEPSITPPNLPPAAYPRQDANVPMDIPVEENIENIPTLLQALKIAIVDREKIDVLQRFLVQGGEEIYYLPEKIPEVLSLFVFQTSRWQFLKTLQDAAHEDTTQEASDPDENELDARKRRKDNISRTIAAVNREISEYDVFDVTKDDQHWLQVSQMPQIRSFRGSSIGKGKGRERLFPEIKGIPEGADVGEEGHIN